MYCTTVVLREAFVMQEVAAVRNRSWHWDVVV
jgi:hypothetical protein